MAVTLITITAYGDSPGKRGAALLIHSPAGPGSAEPHLAQGPGGAVVLSWLERESKDGPVALRYSSLTDGQWQTGTTITRGEHWFVNWADFPSVSPITSDLWAAHWLQKKPGGTYAYDVAISLSQDAGKSWSEPMTPHTDNTRTEHGFVSLFPWQDGVGALWLDGRNMESGGMTLRAAVISPGLSITSENLVDDLVCDCCQTDVALVPTGPIAVYRNRTSDEIRDIYISRAIDGHWEEGRAVGDDGWETAACPVNGPAIAASGSEVVVAWFTMANDIARVRYARSSDGAASFSTPIDIDAEQANGRVDVALLDNGNAVVSWLRTGTDNQGELAIRVVSKTGKLGAVQMIAPTSTNRPAGFPQMISTGAQLVFAWTDTSGDQPSVQTALLDVTLLQE